MSFQGGHTDIAPVPPGQQSHIRRQLPLVVVRRRCWGMGWVGFIRWRWRRGWCTVRRSIETRDRNLKANGTEKVGVAEQSPNFKREADFMFARQKRPAEPVHRCIVDLARGCWVEATRGWGSRPARSISQRFITMSNAVRSAVT